MITKVHMQLTGVRAACGVKIFPHDQPTRMVLQPHLNIQNNGLQLQDVTCKICLLSATYRFALAEHDPK